MSVSLFIKQIEGVIFFIPAIDAVLSTVILAKTLDEDNLSRLFCIFYLIRGITGITVTPVAGRVSYECFYLCDKRFVFFCIFLCTFICLIDLFLCICLFIISSTLICYLKEQHQLVAKVH